MSLGILLQRAGHIIAGCSGRSAASLERASSLLHCPSSTDVTDFIAGADAVLVTVPDDAVEQVVTELSRALAPRTVVAHFAGSLGLGPLAPARAVGSPVAAMHVLQAVPAVEQGVARIPGSWFAATCETPMRDWVSRFVERLGGRVLWIEEKDRPAYHAAAVMASNFLVTLASMVELSGNRIDAFIPLMRGTIDNIAEMGVAGALTGPVVRSDAGTVSKHLTALEARSAALATAYRALSEATVEAALAAGRIDAATAATIRRLLSGT